MRMLALDLGSTTGFAWTQPSGNPMISSYTWATPKELSDAKARRLDRRGDIRVIRFYDWMTDLHNASKFDAVVFEDVEFQTYRMQTQLWSSFRAAVWLAFPNTLIECVPVSTLKKFATGSGAADKLAMEVALQRQHPGLWNKFLDDNAVDAAWLWLWGNQNLSRISP